MIDHDPDPPVRAVPAARFAPISLPSGAARVFELSLGTMLWSRRTVFMALVVGGPVLVALAARLVAAGGVAPLRINGVPVDAAALFGMMVWVFYLRFTVPVLGVFYGTALVADEVEDKTITYLFTRPVRRGAVLVGKYLAYLVCTALVVLPSVLVVYFLIVPFREVGASFAALVADLALLALGLAAYGALFALVGTVMRRPILVGLMFAFGWEQLAVLLPGYLRWFTLAHYLQSLVPHAMPADSSVVFLMQSVMADPASAWVSVVGLVGVSLASLLLAVRVVEWREYVLEP
jgi:ABC-type transport system involved in multi-copper enzyme maturation permease subunit